MCMYIYTHTHNISKIEYVICTMLGDSKSASGIGPSKEKLGKEKVCVYTHTHTHTHTHDIWKIEYVI